MIGRPRRSPLFPSPPLSRSRGASRWARGRGMSDPSRGVLIRGCFWGIGAATASRLAKPGWPVYATARRPETLAALEADGCRTLALDVVDETSRQAAVDAVVEAEGAVGVLINNAGYSQSGAVESIPDDRVRAQ